MTLWAIFLYGFSMAGLGALLVTWAIPMIRVAKDRRSLSDRAFNAAYASFKRWGLPDRMAMDGAKPIARDFANRALIIGYVQANRELDLWIDRAAETNNLLAMSDADALAAIKTFKDARYPHLRRRA